MKITIKKAKKVETTSTFGDLKNGDLFQRNGKWYRKRESYGYSINNMEPKYFNQWDEVKLAKSAEIIIKQFQIVTP